MSYSHERLEYTVIGEPVNMASRLEACCKSFDKEILLSEKVYDQLGPQVKEVFCPLGKKEFKGFDFPVSVYGNSPRWIQKASEHFPREDEMRQGSDFLI